MKEAKSGRAMQPQLGVQSRLSNPVAIRPTRAETIPSHILIPRYSLPITNLSQLTCCNLESINKLRVFGCMWSQKLHVKLCRHTRTRSTFCAPVTCNQLTFLTSVPDLCQFADMILDIIFFFLICSIACKLLKTTIAAICTIMALRMH